MELKESSKFLKLFLFLLWANGLKLTSGSSLYSSQVLDYPPLLRHQSQLNIPNLNLQNGNYQIDKPVVSYHHSGSPRISEDQGEQKLEYIDLSYTFDKDTIFWPFQRFAFLHMRDVGPTVNVTGDGKKVFTYAQFSFCQSEHGGTHIDAPFHFNKFGWKLDEIPIDRLMDLPVVVVDVEKLVFSLRNPADFVLTVEHVKEHERKFGRIPSGAVVFVRFGWSKFWSDKLKYLGWDNSTVPFGGQATFSFPGCDPSVGVWLMRERDIVGLGVDTMSPEVATNLNQGNNYIHINLLENNVYIIEMIANLDYLLQRMRPDEDNHRQPNRNCQDLRATVLPMKTKGTGGPVRIVAYCKKWGI